MFSPRAIVQWPGARRSPAHAEGFRAQCRPPLRLLVLGLLVGCGDAETGQHAAARHALPFEPQLCLLPAERAHALTREPFRLELRRGSRLDGIAAESLDETFDPFVVRLGGMQRTIEPDVQDGRAGVSLVLDSVGDALVGFSATPRSVSLGGQRVWLSQHVKTVFPVTRGPGDVPQPSASVSHRIGLDFEVVPLVDPVPLLAGDELPLRVRFRGPALANCTVRLHRVAGAAGNGNDAEDHVAVTDPVGTAVLPIGGAGTYLVTASHRVAHADGPDELFWAALTFTTGEKR